MTMYYKNEQTIAFRRDTEQLWLRSDPVLLHDEVARTVNDGRFKVGDGVHRWSELPYTDRLPEKCLIRLAR